MVPPTQIWPGGICRVRTGAQANMGLVSECGSLVGSDGEEVRGRERVEEIPALAQLAPTACRLPHHNFLPRPFHPLLLPFLPAVVGASSHPLQLVGEMEVGATATITYYGVTQQLLEQEALPLLSFSITNFTCSICCNVQVVQVAQVVQVVQIAMHISKTPRNSSVPIWMAGLIS